jgi:hypothetical protein
MQFCRFTVFLPFLTLSFLLLFSSYFLTFLLFSYFLTFFLFSFRPFPSFFYFLLILFSSPFRPFPSFSFLPSSNKNVTFFLLSPNRTSGHRLPPRHNHPPPGASERSGRVGHRLRHGLVQGWVGQTRRPVGFGVEQGFEEENRGGCDYSRWYSTVWH